MQILCIFAESLLLHFNCIAPIIFAYNNYLSFTVLAVFSCMRIITVNSVSNLEFRNLPDFAMNMKSIVVQWLFFVFRKIQCSNVSNEGSGLVKTKY